MIPENKIHDHILRIEHTVTETTDAFIFSTLSTYASEKYDIVVDKHELVEAIELVRAIRAHGSDIMKIWDTAQQNEKMLSEAYCKGLEDGIRKERNKIKEYFKED